VLNKHAIWSMALTSGRSHEAHLLGTVPGQQSTEDQLRRFSNSGLVHACAT